MTTQTTSTKPILVITSGDGHIASAVVCYLQEHAPDHFREVRLICKDGDKARNRMESARDVPLRIWVDTENQDKLASAMDGSDLALLIPPAHGNPIEAAEALVTAAQQVGQPGAIFVSWTHSIVAGIDQTKLLKQFRYVENQFMDSPAIQTKTLVHVSLFTEFIKYLARPLVHNGLLPLPVSESAKVAPIDAHGVGTALATMALQWTTAREKFHNQTLSFTGPTLMSPNDLAREIGRAASETGMSVKYVPITMDEAREVVAQSSVCAHPVEVDALMDAFLLWDIGQLAFVSEDIVRVLGINNQPSLVAGIDRIVSELPKMAGDKPIESL